MDSESGVDENKKGSRAVVTAEKALQYAVELENFFLARELLDNAAWAGSASSRILKVMQESKRKQKTLHDFFSIE